MFVWYSDTLLFSYRYVIEPYYEPVMKKFKKCKKVGIRKKVKKQDGMSTIILNYSDKIIRR